MVYVYVVVIPNDARVCVYENKFKTDAAIADDVVTGSKCRAVSIRMPRCVKRGACRDNTIWDWLGPAAVPFQSDNYDDSRHAQPQGSVALSFFLFFAPSIKSLLPRE